MESNFSSSVYPLQSSHSKPATTEALAAVSHQATGYLAMMVKEYLKNIITLIATASYCHRGIHLLQIVLKALQIGGMQVMRMKRDHQRELSVIFELI